MNPDWLERTELLIGENALQKLQKSKVLIVGHTHEPVFREYSDGTKFINTGTWTRMVNLDLSHDLNDTPLTYAKIQIYNNLIN